LCGLFYVNDLASVLGKDLVMPKYKYRCLDCGDSFYFVHKISESVDHCYLRSGGENNVTDGERCDGVVERVPSNTSFSLKGKGWYKDGY